MRVLNWPGYKVYRVEIDEPVKRLKLWVRRKLGNKQLISSGCGQLVSAIFAHLISVLCLEVGTSRRNETSETGTMEPAIEVFPDGQSAHAGLGAPTACLLIAQVNPSTGFD